jgi:hypothetical protein
VTVTAESGLVRVYQVGVFYPDVADATLKLITIDGVEAADGDTVDIAEGTTEVVVVAESTYGGEVAISGGTDLQPGENSLVVTVTSLDGENTAEYTVTLNVALSSDTGLAVFTVNEIAATDNGVINLDPYTTEVEVVVEPVIPEATFEIEGGVELQAGANELLVTVTAANGETTRTYTVNLNVLLGDDVELATFQINGEDVSDGDSITLEYGSESADITAEPVRESTTVEVTGADALRTGRNVVKVLVTAEDGNYRTYRLIVIVAESNDTTVESLTVGGQDATGGSVTLPAGSRAAAVSVVTTDPFATFAVDGGTDLVAGDNTITVTVTAADGETTAEYVITATVEESVAGTEVGVNSITVAGQDGLEGTIEVGVGTRAVRVIVETTDPFASFTVDGNTDLQPGENAVTITVTAADGETTAEYVVTVVIPELSDDTSTELLTVNGLEVADGDSIDLASGTSRVSVKVVTTDPLANFVISGDGRKVGSPLQEGENSLVISVFAQNGDSADTTITLNVLSLSENTELAEEEPLLVNGEVVDIELLDQEAAYLNLPLNTTRISVGVKAADPGADVFVNNKTVWPTLARQFSVEKGINLISIEIVPPAGDSFAKTYVLKVYVGGADATLKSAKVNNTAITFDEGNSATLPGELANGTTSVNIFAEPTVALKTANTPGTRIEFDPAAEPTATANTYKVEGLVTGENTVTITVTPGDENMEAGVYTIIINVARSSDKRLKSILINGAPAVAGSTIVLPKGTDYVEAEAEVVSEFATYEISGLDEILVGVNTAVITVMAEDETTQEYKVTLIVPKAVDKIVVTFPKVGVVTVDAKTNKPGNTIITNQIKKIGAGTVVKVEITNNFLIAKDKPTAGPARATAVQKYLQSLTTKGIKTATYSLIAGAKTQKGTEVTIYYY